MSQKYFDYTSNPVHTARKITVCKQEDGLVKVKTDDIIYEWFYHDKRNVIRDETSYIIEDIATYMIDRVCSIWRGIIRGKRITNIRKKKNVIVFEIQRELDLLSTNKVESCFEAELYSMTKSLEKFFDCEIDFIDQSIIHRKKHPEYGTIQCTHRKFTIYIPLFKLNRKIADEWVKHRYDKPEENKIELIYDHINNSIHYKKENQNNNYCFS